MFAMHVATQRDQKHCNDFADVKDSFTKNNNNESKVVETDHIFSSHCQTQTTRQKSSIFF